MSTKVSNTYTLAAGQQQSWLSATPNRAICRKLPSNKLRGILNCGAISTKRGQERTRGKKEEEARGEGEGKGDGEGGGRVRGKEMERRRGMEREGGRVGYLA